MTTDVSHTPQTGRRWLVLIPVASVMYLLAYLDRTNLSFVLPYMGEDLALTNTDKGLVSGIFFVGYLLLQVPAALLAQRWSAKYTIAILMVLWGLAAVATGLVQNTAELFVVRFILGVFEGGVQPATLVLLAMWFPQRERARASGFWLLAIPLSAVLAAPLTGWMLGFMDWRAVLVVEGIPPIVWAVVWLIIVADRPHKARWMPLAERQAITRQLQIDETVKSELVGESTRYRDVLRNRKVIGLVTAWFLYCTGFYGFTMWLPEALVTLTGGSPQLVGVLTAVPYLLGLVTMALISIRTDRKGSSRAVVLVPLAGAAAALLAGQFVGDPVIAFIFLCLTAGGLYIHGAFFALPPLVLPTKLLGVAVGLIGGIGNLGGFLGPYIAGWLIDVTGTTAVAFSVMSAALLGAGVILAAVSPSKTARRELEERTTGAVATARVVEASGSDGP